MDADSPNRPLDSPSSIVITDNDLRIDGESLPWFIAKDGIELVERPVDMSDGLTTLTLTLLVFQDECTVEDLRSKRAADSA